ncbi:RNA polymerase sigma factor [Actinocorallia sp. A-T 12471]|uniref:RNA polymerase sigma factor n=1 Tax=Actinocorallia sp. A-T 12471 TaxID=3089813 RepID=UPI0029CBE265|nr:RNA polymerase sigma factor [Actinocorallia sp. A-T 12471]MDX6738755.1 RNA polymerase sigma factor [Actinocorallia sp. A-T 12471]
MKAEPPEDARLLREVARGDEAALRRLYERHATWLFVRLLRRCNDEDLVSDVLQDTFVAVWRGAGSWRGDGDPAAWIWGIAIRRLVSRLRGGRAPRPVPDDSLDLAAARAASAEETVLLGVEHGDLGTALSRMSPELRAVVQATVLDGLSTREAAALLGLPHGTVKTRVRRAKAQLRWEMANPGSTR